MNKFVMLSFNMGNSGGKWFQDICNIHEDVQIWQEANHILGVNQLNDRTQLDIVYDFFMDQYQNSPKKTIGLCKAFDDRLVRFCEEKQGCIIQMFRHPVGVIDFKNGHKMVECAQRGLFECLDTAEKIFEAHVDFYASRYKSYLENAPKWPLVKLEELKISIRENTPYFRTVLERALNVEWEERHTKKVLEMGGLSEDTSHYDIWNSWDSWKKDIFLKYFEDIMNASGYKWQ